MTQRDPGDPLAAGSPLRDAVDAILAAGMGALFVVGGTGLDVVCDGGFRIGVAATPQRLFELAKMDGAVVLDERGATILMANVHLVPGADVLTGETGIRHRTAERASVQTGATVVAVSRSRRSVTVYRAGLRESLQSG